MKKGIKGMKRMNRNQRCGSSKRNDDSDVEIMNMELIIIIKYESINLSLLYHMSVE
jgi:hypothetical protein